MINETVGGGQEGVIGQPPSFEQGSEDDEGEDGKEIGEDQGVPDSDAIARDNGQKIFQDVVKGLGKGFESETGTAEPAVKFDSCSGAAQFQRLSAALTRKGGRGHHFPMGH